MGVSDCLLVVKNRRWGGEVKEKDGWFNWLGSGCGGGAVQTIKGWREIFCYIKVKLILRNINKIIPSKRKKNTAISFEE